MRISVVIPLFNKAPYIQQTIRSVLAGEVLPMEIIVVDDGSQDDGGALALELGTPLVKVLRQANAGVSAARNRGIDASQGDYVAFLDADDWWAPTFLSQIVWMIKHMDGCSLYATAYTRRSEGGHCTPSSLQGLHETTQPSRVGNFFEVWSHGSFFCSSSVVVPRALFADATLRFPLGESLGEDQDMWFRLAERGDIGFDPVTAATYRLGTVGNLSRNTLPPAEVPCIARLTARYHSAAFPAQHRRGAARLLGVNQVVLARRLASCGDRRLAWRWLGKTSSQHGRLFWLRSLIWICCPTSIARYLQGSN